MILLFNFIKALSASKKMILASLFFAGIATILFFILKNKDLNKNFFKISLIFIYIISFFSGIYFILTPVILISSVEIVTYLIIFSVFAFILIKFLPLKFHHLNWKNFALIFLPWIFAVLVVVTDSNPTYKIFIAKTIIAGSLIIFSGFWLTFSFALFGSTTFSDMQNTMNFFVVLAFIMWSAQTVIKPAWEGFLRNIGTGVPGYILVTALIIQTIIEAWENRKLYGNFYF